MKLLNKKASFDYEIREKIEAGIMLTGAEVKAVRAKKVDFLGSYVKPINNEMFLINLHIGAEDELDSRKTEQNKGEEIDLDTHFAVY
jgi:SsrA-binding protein